jgi:hypothetical protein
MEKEYMQGSAWEYKILGVLSTSVCVVYQHHEAACM